MEHELLYAERIKHIPKSFIREILKVTAQPDVISFAGGLPNPAFFPVEGIKEAARKVLEEDGKNVLQYAVSEGYLPLREFIANRYQKKGLKVSPDEILITNGSQQGLDLLAKVFINQEDFVLMERPSYLGAIQALSFYQPEFLTVDLLENGPDLQELEEILTQSPVKLFYSVPNFQNPTGISYSFNKRKEIASLIQHFNLLLVEDDPYGDIQFDESPNISFRQLLPDQTILLGSFSKIVSPGMRLGWIVAKEEVIEKLIIAKQASDLHSNNLSQRVIFQYLQNGSLDEHIQLIKEEYKKQRDAMLHLIERYLPREVQCTKPEGGMFTWLTLPDHCSTYELLKSAAKENVAFVPGRIFFLDQARDNTMRLNFSNTDFPKMEEGLKRLGKIIYKSMLGVY